MTATEIKAKTVAAALRANGKQRISQETANATLREQILAMPDENPADIASAFLNLSALNQELERHGLITTPRAKPALIVAIEAALA